MPRASDYNSRRAEINKMFTDKNTEKTEKQEEKIEIKSKLYITYNIIFN